MPFRNILFPVDLSEMSGQLAPTVRAMAERLHAKVHVIFCARLFEHFVSIYVPHTTINNFEAEIMRGAEQKLTEFVTTHLKDVNCVHKVVSGDPAEEILNYAAKESIDLIIIGSHGRQAVDRILFGSVAERVVKHSPLPVLTLKPTKQE